jgi:carbonic anhydrase
MSAESPNNSSAMKTAHFALFALLAAPAVVRGSEAKFNYNPDSPYGPAFWGDLKIDNNQCNGDKNSPIAIETSCCDVKANYTLKVNISYDLSSSYSAGFDPNALSNLGRP